MQNFKLWVKEMQYLSNSFHGNMALLPVGDDFSFYDSRSVFQRIDFYIQTLRMNQELTFPNARVQYSTVQQYLTKLGGNEQVLEKVQEEESKDSVPLKQSYDLIASRDSEEIIWSGYFVTRQNFKYEIVKFGQFIDSVSNFYTSRIRFINENWFDYKRWELKFVRIIERAKYLKAALTHHDAITGTSL